MKNIMIEDADASDEDAGGDAGDNSGYPYDDVNADGWGLVLPM